MLLYAQLAILVVLVALNTWLGIDNHLYHAIWWWDIPTHFLGGMWAAFGAAWLFTLNKKKIILSQCVGFALSLGIAWEIFEYGANIERSIFMPYWLDTTKDLVVDTLGGLAAGMLIPKLQKIWRK